MATRVEATLEGYQFWLRPSAWCGGAVGALWGKLVLVKAIQGRSCFGGVPAEACPQENTGGVSDSSKVDGDCQKWHTLALCQEGRRKTRKMVPTSASVLEKFPTDAYPSGTHPKISHYISFTYSPGTF